MDKKQRVKRLDRQLSAMILVHNYLQRLVNDNFEEMREVSPELANIVRKDINTLNRNFAFFSDKFPEAKCGDLCDDHEKLSKIIDEFINL